MRPLLTVSRCVHDDEAVARLSPTGEGAADCEGAEDPAPAAPATADTARPAAGGGATAASTSNHDLKRLTGLDSEARCRLTAHPTGGSSEAAATLGAEDVERDVLHALWHGPAVWAWRTKGCERCHPLG